MDMTRSGFFQEVLENVRNVSIRDLILNKYELQSGLCPFHNDRSAGSFSVVERRRSYRCWSCGASGDAIAFVMESEKIAFPEAVFKIALLYDIVDMKQVNAYMSGTGFSEMDAKVIRTYENLWVDEMEGHRAEQEVIENVFDVFALGETVIEGKEDRLSAEHRKHLMEERGLTEEEIDSMGYFTIPSRSTRYTKHFFDVLKNRFDYAPDIVKGVPGFYKKKKDDSSRAYTFLSKKGIGIPVRNVDGRISGIQIRKDVAKKGESRYIWLSSSFANSKDDLEFGTGSGSPVHISNPKENKFPHLLFITEGIFKSEAIAKEYGAHAISIQGIQSWKTTLLASIEELAEREQTYWVNIMVMFDADIASNIHVYEGMKRMVEEIQSEYPDVHFLYAWWEKDFGKGIDDVLKEGYQKQVKKVEVSSLIESYDGIIETLELEHGMKIHDILIDYGNECLEEKFVSHVRPLFYP